MGLVKGGPMTPNPHPTLWSGQNVEEVGTTFGPNLVPKALAYSKWWAVNHLEERLLDQAQARASYTPLFWGRSRSIPQCMVSNV